MKKINNYIQEKLHISKNLKTDSIKVGMKIQSDDALYELIDFITADASDNEISAFLKKYKNVGNAGAWVYNIKDYKLTPEGRKSLDEFGYIMILKYVKYTSDYIMVFYNQKFFHPINEKLHISKDYKTSKYKVGDILYIDSLMNPLFFRIEEEIDDSTFILAHLYDKNGKPNNSENYWWTDKFKLNANNKFEYKGHELEYYEEDR